MKTPAQVADEVIVTRFGIHPALSAPTVTLTMDELREFIESAVATDRAKLPFTLGDIAEILERLKKSGITLGALQYAASQVWWEGR